MDKKASKSLKNISQGYTKAPFGGRSIYFKHLSLLSHHPIEEFYEETEEWARSKGLPTQKEQLELLVKEGLWTDEKEKEIEKLESFIKYNKEALPKAFIGQQRNELKKQIDKAEDDLLLLNFEKTELLGETVEKVSNRRASEFLIYKSSYSDRKMKKKFFGKEEFEELDARAIQQVVRLYNQSEARHSSEAIRKISIDPYFLTMFRLCKSPRDFFGKPSIIELTYQQIELLNYAMTFSKIILNNKIPEKIKDDPDGILDWYVSKNTNSERVEKLKGRNGASSIVGSSREELEEMGMGSGIDLKKAIQSGASKAEILKMMS